MVTHHLPQAQSCPASLWAVATLEDSPTPPPFFIYPQFCLLSMVCNIPLVSWGQLSQLCRLPTSCPPLAYTLGTGTEREKEKASVFCKQCPGTDKLLVCYRYCFSQSPRHSSILAAMKKVNCIPARSSTTAHVYFKAMQYWLFFQQLRMRLLKNQLIVQ